MRSQILCDIRYRVAGSILLFALCGSVAVAPSTADQQPPPATTAHAPQADLLLRPHNEIIQGTDQSALIREARHTYYSLKGEGLEEVRCQAVPDWESIFKTMRPSPANPDQLLPLLEKVRFQVAIGPGGGAMVSRVAHTFRNLECMRYDSDVGRVARILTLLCLGSAKLSGVGFRTILQQQILRRFAPQNDG